MKPDSVRGRPGPADPGHEPSLQAWPGPRSAAPGQETPAGNRPVKLWAFAAAGTAAAAAPAGPGLAFALAGHPQAAVPLLIGSGVIGLASILAGAAVKIHDSAQRTRRLEIQNAGPTAIAEAIARCIDDTHAAALDVAARQRPAAAASVRASASQAVTQMMPAMLAAIGQQTPRHSGLGDPQTRQRPARP